MLNFYGKTFSARLLIGSALYPSPAIMQDAIRASGANIVTVSLRRESAGGKTGDAFWNLIRELDVTVLPNTAGCRSVREAVTTAKLARELFATSWIKLEVIADNDTLQPDVVGLVEAAQVLIKDGFEVFPYCTEDLSVAIRLVDAGCKVVMPWAAPIGSAKGIINRDALRLLRDRLPDVTLVVDAGLCAPSHAAHALELGDDARLALLVVGTIQLRANNLNDGEALQIVTDALAVIKGTPAKLVVNDYWRAAIVAGAQHLHLGQEDLAGADLNAIREAKLTLGIP